MDARARIPEVDAGPPDGALAPERHRERLCEALVGGGRLLSDPRASAGPVADWNKDIIEEFRQNEGKVGGFFDGATILLLHTKGRGRGRNT